MILLRKKDLYRAGGLLVFFATFSAMMWAGSLRTPMPAFSASDERCPLIVVDAGHGGEDGGAVSADGVEESDINLEIAKKVNGLFRFFGIRTVMVRTEDVMVSDPGLATMRERKVSDIHNRAALVNSLPDALLLSIHQNSLPSSAVTHGAQAFWNDQAQLWAEATQALLNSCINERAKEPRKIPSNIYLMNRANVPALLVECGFLSNAQETELLQTQCHQIKLATAITAGYFNWIAGKGNP